MTAPSEWRRPEPIPPRHEHAGDPVEMVPSPRDLSVDEQIVLTAIIDRERRGERPGTAEEIAAGTAWPGRRTFEVARTRKVLDEWRAAGWVRRIQSRSQGVH